jgi:hypothetical protein
MTSRERKYIQYLKSPEARVEAILDELDEERINREVKESRVFRRKGFRKWAKDSLSP